MKAKIKTEMDNWQAWNDLGVRARSEFLSAWAEKLTGKSAYMVKYQIKHGLSHIEEVKLMPGATGESNELYCSGRGIFAIHAEENCPIEAIVGMVASALLAGNCIALSLADNAMNENIKTTLERAGLVDQVSEQPLLFGNDHDLAGVAFVGSLEE